MDGDKLKYSCHQKIADFLTKNSWKISETCLFKAEKVKKKPDSFFCKMGLLLTQNTQVLGVTVPRQTFALK